MAPSEIHSRDITLYQPFSSPNITPQASFTGSRRRQPDSGYSQQSQNFTKTNLNHPTSSHYHGIEQLGRSAPELRLVMKRAGLDRQPRPRHRRGGRSGKDNGQNQEKTPAPLPLEVEEDDGAKKGLLEVDWKEDDKESERPCYWSLLEKLNQELQITKK
ncbi:hypothetical protein VSDG_09695 [Cytospora chrysosperma]|uniref:Uncharacterized protein n=1 Tax=Cytospora chrysosperma TaxID=252740 RepID=A0A423V941_CYTCH|nr:hypothetical protein VSDG_09695 [Valsa sordida]